ncbi:MAG: type II CAAX endopeptidase family protein [Pseudanabaenaceae cyanobacterium bins.39]|nr:type II CAAX endopeptidase family protein [Pseudanabaenaceae cyanobacterium bins.39]
MESQPPHNKPADAKSWSLKSWLLSILSLFSILFIVLTLQASWHHPQEQTKLDLLQTDLILQASQPAYDRAVQDNNSSQIAQLLLSDGGSQDIYAQALKSYQEVLKSNQAVLERELTDSSLASLDIPLKKRLHIVSELGIRTGLLQIQTGQRSEAIATWQNVGQIEGQEMTKYGLTAKILIGLWSEPAMLFPDAEAQIRRSLDGWYQYAALTKLYEVQQRSDKLPELAQSQQVDITSAINRLLIVNLIPLVGGGVGLLLWLFLLGQWIFFRQSSPLTVSKESSNRLWQVPWGLDKIWEVMVLWFTAFCLMTQFILPLIFDFLGLTRNVQESYLLQSLLVLIPYVLSVMPMLPILHLSLEAYRPLPVGWFQFKLLPPQWLLWGVGGYFASVPLVVIVSLVSQKLLQGQGGGNPLLPILVDSQDNIPKFLLWVTLAIAAPFFEEYLFRGFLLPSLTKLMPIWGAIAISGFLFALAHLNVADIIPLSVLGIVMGFVYWRSGNLLSSMLLHCLWNSGSFLALIALGGK